MLPPHHSPLAPYSPRSVNTVLLPSANCLTCSWCIRWCGIAVVGVVLAPGVAPVVVAVAGVGPVVSVVAGGRGGGGGGRGGGLGAVGGGVPDSSNPGADPGLPDAPGPQAGENVVSGESYTGRSALCHHVLTMNLM